jgi:hypothetical protein
MMEQDDYFTEDNIMSTLGIELEKHLYMEIIGSGLKEKAILMVSSDKIFIPFSHLTGDFKLDDKDNPIIGMRVKGKRTSIGNPYIPSIEIKNPAINRIMDIGNRHLDIFTELNTIKGLYQEQHKEDIVFFNFDCHYKIIDNTLVLVELVYKSIYFIRTYDDYTKNRRFDVQDIIDNILLLLGVDCIDESTNIEEIVELMIKQLLVEEMKTI